MECMALMILSRSIEELDELFENIVQILLTKDEEKAKEYILKLTDSQPAQKIKDQNKLIEETNLKDDNEIDDEDETGDKEIEVNDETEINVDDELNKKIENEIPKEYEILLKPTKYRSVYSQSAYYQRYLEIVVKIVMKVSLIQKSMDEITNVYYSPEFVKYLLVTFMPYSPLWTALSMDLIDPSISSITNAFAESMMKQYEYLILHNSRKFSIGEVCRLLNSDIEKLIKENELSKLATKSRIKPSSNALYRKPTKNLLDAEKWNRKTTNVKRLNIKKRKVQHMDGKKLLKLRNKLETGKNKENIENPKKLSTENCKKSSDLENIKDEKIIGKNTGMTKEKLRFTEVNNKFSSINVQPLKILSNGLVDDLIYYTKSQSKNIVISHFIPKSDSFIGQGEYTFTAKQFRNVISIQGPVNSDVIDIFTMSHITEWVDMSYLSTNVGCCAFKDGRKKISIQEKNSYDISQELADTILLPFCQNEHWRLLMINQKNECLELLDPYERSGNLARVLKAFLKYLELCDTKSSMKKLLSKKWMIKEGPNRPFQQPYDDFSSAVYVTYYIQCIGRKIQFDDEFDPEKFRKEILTAIVKGSEPLTDKCLYCLKNDIKDYDMRCELCNRLIHLHCEDRDNMDTDDEEKEEFEDDEQICKRIKYGTILKERISYRCRL